MFEQDNSPEMNDNEFKLLTELIYDHCGLYFELEKKYFLRKRLSKRLALHQTPTYQDYHLFLKYDPRADEELAIIVDLLTTNETYFFRENYQLKAFIDEIVPEIAGRKADKTLRVWSAGCSTGEEPYTIAILLLENLARAGIRGWNIEILGSDISHRVLTVARKGVYSESSFRDMDRSYLTYFEEIDGSKRRVKDEIKDMVSFMNLNLIDSNKIRLLKTMDVIFCRNVIIYFDQTIKKHVIQNFYDLLDHGAYLLLGHSESLMNISTLFTLKHLKNDMVYQKPSKDSLKDKMVEAVREKITDSPAPAATVSWNDLWKDK